MLFFKMRFFLKLLLGVVFLSVHGFSYAEKPQSSPTPRCQSMSAAEFQSFLKTQPRPVTLVFFSTWCADCKPHLQGLKTIDSHTILIHTFRVSKNEDAVLKNLGVSGDIPCVNDDSRDIAKDFGVKMVPGEVRLP